MAFTNRCKGTGEGVWIPDATKYGLGAGFPAPNHNKSDTRTEFYHISNHHQLHCLVSLSSASKAHTLTFTRI